jgi:hypothetical protein
MLWSTQSHPDAAAHARSGHPSLRGTHLHLGGGSLQQSIYNRSRGIDDSRRAPRQSLPIRQA